jgi:hypothetical protein
VLPRGAIDALPEMVVTGLTVETCRLGRYDVALVTQLSLDVYLHLGETLGFAQENLSPPQRSLGAAGAHWSLLLHSPSQGPGKTGIFDDSIILDDDLRQWLHVDLGELHRQMLPGTKLFSFHLADWNRMFKKAIAALYLKPILLYALRHAGPTADVLHHRRSLAEVKKWGRWTWDSSLGRYEKTGKSLALVGKLGMNIKLHLLNCEKELSSIMHRRTVAPKFAG